MLVAIVFAQVWGVIQLVALGSFARTTRLRTALAGVAVGFYLCAPVALLFQLAWMPAWSRLTGTPMYLLGNIGSYTADPFIEEIVKVSPVVLLLMVPAIRRQWSITDCVLVGAAAGSGFGLAEALYRHGAFPHLARANHAGWLLAQGLLVQVPGVWTTLTSWLPAGATDADIFFPGEHGYPWLNLHLAWSAIAGLAVGLIRLRRGAVARIGGIVLLLYVGLDHAAWNGRYANSWLSHFVFPPFTAVRHVLIFLPIAALVVAWWLDRGRQSGRGTTDLTTLHAEQAASPRWVGTIRAAVSRLPWSVPSVYGLSRVRRAYNTARTSGSQEESAGLRGVVVDARDRIDQELRQPTSSPLLPPGWTPRALLGAMRRPTVIVSLVLITPAFLWGVVGGWPQTAWLQKTVTGPIAWNVVRVLALAAQASLAWGVVVGARSWSKARRMPIGDDTALLGLRIACGVGAFSLAGYALLRSLSVSRPESLLALAAFGHVSDAFGYLGVAPALMYAGGASFALPPGFSFKAPIRDHESADHYSPGRSNDFSPESDVAPDPGRTKTTPPPPKTAGPASRANSHAENEYVPITNDAEGTYVGEIEDPNFAQGTYAGELDDPSSLGDAAPGDGAPDMSLDQMAAWAADADAREAEDGAATADADARAADAHAADAVRTFEHANEAWHDQTGKDFSDEAKAGEYGGSSPEQQASYAEEKRVRDEAGRADWAALHDAAAAEQAAEAARLRAAVAHADAEDARAEAAAAQARADAAAEQKRKGLKT